MSEEQDLIRDKVLRFYDLIRDLYPVKKVFLYGSYAKGYASASSDIDVGVVVDFPDHHNRIEITSQLFHYASQIDVCIEPKCIFWDEYQNNEKGSILSEIVRTGVEVM